MDHELRPWLDCRPVRFGLNGYGIHEKGIIKRNEIITLLSSLMASGLKTNLIIASMESIVLDIFDSSKKARDPQTR